MGKEMSGLLTMQDLANGHLDVKALGEAANGDENTIVTTRTGETYPSVKKAFKTMFEAGGLPAKPEPTKASMEGNDLVDGDYAVVTNDGDNNGLYVKTAGAWVKSEYDLVALARDYTDTAVEGKLSYIRKELSSTLLSNNYVSTTANEVIFDNSLTYTTRKFTIEKNKKYNIKVVGKDKTRFRVAVNNTAITNNSTSVVTRVLTRDDELNTLIFDSGDNVELYVYIGLGTVTANCTVAEYPYKTEHPILAEGLVRDIATKDIADKAITTEKTNFVQEFTTNRAVTKVDMIVLYNVEGDRVYISPATDSWCYAAAITPNEVATITLPDGVNNSFRVVVMNDDILSAEGKPTVDRVINLDSSLRTINFENDELGKWLLINVNTITSTPITVVPDVSIIERKIKGLTVPPLVDVSRHKYRLVLGKIENTTKSTLGNEAEYPRLACVKYEYKPDLMPTPVGYLYTSTIAPYEILYSSGVPDRMEKIADWNMGLTWRGNNVPYEYGTFVADSGDIICVARGTFSGSAVTPDARKNPIIYPAGDYSNPVVVDFGDGIKPTAWARGNGVTSIPDKDYFLFCEYTRPPHGQMYIWKVTKPYTNPDNWQIVKEFTIDRPGSNHKEGNLKHFHALNYDPFSGALICSTGDYAEGAKILMSKDNGTTWDLIAEGEEKHCRLSQVSFDKDYIYWGVDSAATNKHVFIRAPRSEDGYPDLRINMQEVLYVFPNYSGSAATYNTIRLTNPDGLLFLDRQDSNTTTIPLDIYFWSLVEAKMYKVASFDKIEGAASEGKGFRNESVCLYQPLNDERIMVGFDDYKNPNSLDVLGNTLDKRLNNLTLKVVVDNY